jgi:hypothetical protein
MSLNKRLLLLLALPFILFQPAHSQVETKEAVTCPASLSITESATAPSGWSAESATKDHPLQRISVFQKSSAGEIFDLAPDHTSRQAAIVQQQWTLSHDPALKTYLRCRYRNTEATLVLDLKPEIKVCKFKFAAGPHGAVKDVLNITCK